MRKEKKKKKRREKRREKRRKKERKKEKKRGKKVEKKRIKKSEKRNMQKMGNRAERVNVRCALWMMRAVFSISDLGPRRLSVRSMSVSSPL